MFLGDTGISGQVAFSNDRSRLVVAGTVDLVNRPPLFENLQPPIKLYIWRLADKTLVKQIETAVIYREFRNHTVFYWMENIVVCTNQRFLVYAGDTREIVRVHSHPHIASVTHKDDENLVFIDNEKNLRSFDISSGVVQYITLLRQEYWLNGILQNRWLIVDHEGVPLILDLQNKCSPVFSFSKCLAVQVLKGESFIYMWDSLDLKAWELNESTVILTNISTTTLPKPKYNSLSSDRGMVGNSFFVEMDRAPRPYDKNNKVVPYMGVLNVTNSHVQSLQFPPAHQSGRAPFYVESNGKELFVSVEPVDNKSTRGVELAVYPANRYF